MAMVETRLGRWYYDEHGETVAEGDPAVVLLHGLMLDRRMWDDQIEVLRRVGRVLVLDGPGHGLSEVPKPFTLEQQADALADALGAVGVKRAVLVGHGWGGMVAMRFALQHPSLTAGLALINTTADREEPRQRRSRRALIARLTQFGAPRWLVRTRVAPLIYGAKAVRQRPGLVAGLHRTLNGHPRQGLVRAAEAVIERGSVASRLRKVTAPTLVICGQRDRTLAPRHAEALARRIPGARLVSLDAGHNPPVGRPMLTRSVLLRFVRPCLARRPQPSRALIPLSLAG
jgi:3-oxoadipate enol-lactonase